MYSPSSCKNAFITKIIWMLDSQLKNSPIIAQPTLTLPMSKVNTSSDFSIFLASSSSSSISIPSLNQAISVAGLMFPTCSKREWKRGILTSIFSGTDRQFHVPTFDSQSLTLHIRCTSHSGVTLKLRYSTK